MQLLENHFILVSIIAGRNARPLVSVFASIDTYRRIVDEIAKSCDLLPRNPLRSSIHHAFLPLLRNLSAIENVSVLPRGPVTSGGQTPIVARAALSAILGDG